MQTKLSHIQCNVNPAHLPFYRDLMALLGWQPIFSNDEMLGVSAAGGASVWFVRQTKAANNDYDGPGMNHLAFGTGAQADVDAVADHLRRRGVALLFETPRHRPEFAQSAAHTYYQVMFESPDRLLLEVVYEGTKTP